MKHSLQTAIGASLLAMALTGQAWAGSYTMTLIPEQEIALEWAVAQQPEQNPPATATRLLQEIVDNAVRQWMAQQEAITGEKMGKQWGELSEDDRQKVCAVVSLEGCK